MAKRNEPAPENPPLGSIRTKALQELLAHIEQIENSHAGRAASFMELRILIMQKRGIEIMLYGEARTPFPSTHHA